MSTAENKERTPKNTHFSIAVIGAGAAGLMAASAAAATAAQCSVVVIEQGDVPARKLNITGGGRGNFTHQADMRELASAFYEDKAARFLRPAFSCLDSTALRRFFAQNSVPSVVENDGRVFPLSMKAADLSAALYRSCTKSKVRFLLRHRLLKCQPATPQGGFELTLKNYAAIDRMGHSDKLSLSADCVILCTGGASFVHTGSDGSGYRILQELGHTIRPAQAGLHEIILAPHPWAALSGLTFDDVQLNAVPKAELPADRAKQLRKSAAERGRLLITHRGFSGPAALHLSRWLGSEAETISLNLLPQMRPEEFSSTLAAYASLHPHKQVSSFLELYLEKNAARLILEEYLATGASVQLAHCGKKQTQLLLRLLFTRTYSVKTDDLRLERAMVSSGGLQLSELHAGTMESRLIPGLYVAGELLDVDGRSGGYNLQAAFSTGYLAGQSAAQRLQL